MIGLISDKRVSVGAIELWISDIGEVTYHGLKTLETRLLPLFRNAVAQFVGQE